MAEDDLRHRINRTKPMITSRKRRWLDDVLDDDDNEDEIDVYMYTEWIRCRPDAYSITPGNLDLYDFSKSNERVDRLCTSKVRVNDSRYKILKVWCLVNVVDVWGKPLLTLSEFDEESFQRSKKEFVREHMLFLLENRHGLVTREQADMFIDKF